VAALAGEFFDVHPPVGIRDLLAFVMTLVFVAFLVVLIDHTGHVRAQVMSAGAAGVAGACVTAWRRPV
jgi:hypothetical protein